MTTHRPLRAAAAAALAALCLTVSTASAQLAADTARRIDAVFARLDHTNGPGCVLGVDRNGQPLYRKAYGLASLEFRVPLTVDSRLESGSVAKQFVAAAIVLLAQEGKVDLDAPVRRYVPELPDYGSPVTVRMLLHHTSGVRDMWTLFELAGQGMGTRLFTMDQALRMIVRQRELNFPPNSDYLYSNSGFLLLAYIVERTSGEPLAAFSAHRFFEPLGMTHTQWRDHWNRVVPDRATAYAPEHGTYERAAPFMDVYGAGGLLTTVGDLLIWNEQLNHPTIGGRALVDAMETPAVLTTGRKVNYGLGLSLETFRGTREVSHGGATGGYRTFLTRWPDRGLSMAVICNAADAGPDRLAHQVADILMGTGPTEGDRAQAATAAPSAADLAPLEGLYRAPSTEEVIRIGRRDSTLIADIGIEVPLRPAGIRRFRFGGAELRFDAPSGGRSPGMVRVDGDDELRFEAVRLPRPSAADLAAYVGRYYSDELDATYVIGIDDGRLQVTRPDSRPIGLDLSAPATFASPEAARRFSRTKGRIDGFALFAGRVRNLRFVRQGP